MFISTVNHSSGEQLPMLLNSDRLPIVAANEFLLARRALATNTLKRNAQELAVLYKWLSKNKIDLDERIHTGNGFSEAEIRGGLIEFLRRNYSNSSVQNLTVSGEVFHQRVLTCLQFITDRYNSFLGSLPLIDNTYEKVMEQKNYIENWITSSVRKRSPSVKLGFNSLTSSQVSFLTDIIHPSRSHSIWKNSAIRSRNYISIMLMLNYGFRPGEVLSLLVEDIEFGAISAIRLQRRAADPNDSRSSRPQIKRNGRVLPVDNPVFARDLDDYILTHREILSKRNDSEYLIINNQGQPLSRNSLIEIFKNLRQRFPNNLPQNFSAKALRHTFSNELEKRLRANGVDENRRAQILAHLRGDSSLDSQAVYLKQETNELAQQALVNYQNDLMNNKG